MRSALTSHWPLAVLAAIALPLIFARLGAECLWEDEGDTAVLASSIVKSGIPKAWDGVTFTDSDRGERVNGAARVRALVGVRPDHDHSHRPFDCVDEADSGGHVSLGAAAKLLSGHAGGPRAATGDTTSGRSDHWSTESQ